MDLYSLDRIGRLERYMDDRRTETRLLCAELVEVGWKDKSGWQRRRIANLEDISLSGACLHMEVPLLRDTTVKMNYGGGELVGTVRYCSYRDMGYYVGVQFLPGCKWSSKRFRPKHLLDPRQLLKQVKRRAKTAQPSEEPGITGLSPNNP